MRSLLLITILVAGFACGSTKNAGVKPGELNGIWIPVKQEMGGTALPVAAFEKETLIIDNNTYSFTAESVDKGNLTYSSGKMDIYGKDGVNAGKHFPAIYEYENGQLTICYNLSGDGYPDAFDTKGKPSYFISVFKKN